MKKIYFSVGFLLTFFSANAQSQWVTNGNNIYYSTGMVGIGTLNPATALEVGATSSMGGIRSFGTSDLGSGSGGGLIAVTRLTPTAIDQRLGIVAFGSINTGSTYKYSSSISSYSSEGWGINNSGSYMIFKTTPSGTTVATEKMRIDNNGNVGIGTTAPLTKLQINGALLSGNQSTANLDPNTNNVTGFNDLSFLANTGQMLLGWNRSGSEGETDLVSNRGLGSNGGFAFYDYANSGTTPQAQLMRIRSTGEVLIGVSNFMQNIGTTNKLAVGGGIITDAITVKLQGAWPDNVFKPNYNLISLNELKAFIDRNHHLPEIPSEAEVQKGGQNLGEMNRLLLKKVEELTLYLVEKDKELKLQQSNYRALDDKMLQEEERIKKLEAAVEVINGSNGTARN